MRDPFIARIARALEALEPPSRVLLAVSGGADSVAMLHALAQARSRRALRHLEIAVAHVDHGLRGDSDRDAKLVEHHASELGLPFRSRRVTVPEGRGGLADSARQIRYAALSDMAWELKCAAIVTGHTASDQAETMLWHLVRGTGARGLGAMRARRDLNGLELLRPLLGMTRQETRDFCERKRLIFHDDPTNVGDSPRARLRAEVIPVLERLLPGATQRFAAAADRLRADDELLESLADSLDTDDLKKLASSPEPLRRRALIRWFADHSGGRSGLTSLHLEQLDKLIRTQRGQVELPASHRERRVAVVQNDALLIAHHPREQEGRLAGRKDEGSGEEPEE